MTTIQYYFRETDIAYFEPENIYDIADTICRLYHSESDRRKLAQNAASFSARYNWDSMKQDLFDVIDRW